MFTLKLGGQIGLEGRELRIREEAFWEELKGTYSWNAWTVAECPRVAACGERVWEPWKVGQKEG